MPLLRCLGEHPSDSLASQALAGLDNGTGRDEGAVTGQHYIQPINDLMKRFFAPERHPDNAPDHHFQRQAALTQSHRAGLSKATGNQLRVGIIPQGSLRVTQ
jgi:hypothetical protein